MKNLHKIQITNLPPLVIEVAELWEEPYGDDYQLCYNVSEKRLYYKNPDHYLSAFTMDNHWTPLIEEQAIRHWINNQKLVGTKPVIFEPEMVTII